MKNYTEETDTSAEFAKGQDNGQEYLQSYGGLGFYFLYLQIFGYMLYYEWYKKRITKNFQNKCRQFIFKI